MSVAGAGAGVVWGLVALAGIEFCAAQKGATVEARTQNRPAIRMLIWGNSMPDVITSRLRLFPRDHVYTVGTAMICFAAKFFEPSPNFESEWGKGAPQRI
jgi:hypothetical protein